LDRDVPAQPPIARAIHFSHTAGTEQRHDVVAADTRVWSNRQLGRIIRRSRRAPAPAAVETGGGSADRKELVDFVGRPWDDVDADQLADLAGGGGAGVGRRLHGADIA